MYFQAPMAHAIFSPTQQVVTRNWNIQNKILYCKQH